MFFMLHTARACKQQGTAKEVGYLSEKLEVQPVACSAPSYSSPRSCCSFLLHYSRQCFKTDALSEQEPETMAAVMFKCIFTRKTYGRFL